VTFFEPLTNPIQVAWDVLLALGAAWGIRRFDAWRLRRSRGSVEKTIAPNAGSEVLSDGGTAYVNITPSGIA
jgi:hypothetical protein